MMTFKQAAKNIINAIIGIVGKTKVGRYWYTKIVNNAMSNAHEVRHDDVTMKFSVPNSLCQWRADSFSTKEPETLEWINTLPNKTILWDIGANIGLYSVYAAKKRNCQVWAFEPSVFNVEILARNIFINDLTKNICIVPMPLSDCLGSSQMRMVTTDWGGALSTFGKEFGWDGKAINQVFEFQTIGLSMEDAVTKMKVPTPDFIKMDVDGLEHFILKGGASVLASVKGVLIEVNDDFHEQAEQCNKLLKKAGLVLLDKRHSDLIANSTSGFHNSYNQIWARP